MVFQAPQGPSFFDGLRILFVDSSADERDLFTLRFEQLGAVVTAVATADEALDTLRDEGIDLLVADLVLPTVSGLELVRRMRALPPDRGGKTPAIAVTALVSPRSVDEALVAGFTTFLTKPYATETVVGAIRELMPQVEELRAIRAGSRTTSHLAFREQLRSRRVQLQKRHARVLVANGTEQERHFAMKTLALLTAQDFGETHFCAPLDDVEVAPSVREDEGSERWVATAVCGRELLTIELVIGPSGDVAVQRMEPVRIVVH